MIIRSSACSQDSSHCRKFNVNTANFQGLSSACSHQETAYRQEMSSRASLIEDG